MAKEKILVVDDEEDILELVKYNLQKEGYQIISATTGENALTLARSQLPGMILLDLMLPGIDGLEVCKILKNDSKTLNIPIVMLTAKGDESDIVTGLELGADDYITKPFSPRVLIARVRNVLRKIKKGAAESGSVLNIHNITVHPGRHEVLIDGKNVDLSPTEFGILHFLARRPGWVFSRYDIVNGVRGEDSIVTDRSVDVQIVGLRKKLGEAGKFIETVRGVGYRFKD